MRLHIPCRSYLVWLATCSLSASSARAQCLDLKPGFELPGPSNSVWSLATLDAGAGPALYAGGAFTDVDGHHANHIAKWDGAAWTALGMGVDGDVKSIAVFDDGTGPAVYAGGVFTSAGGTPANGIAKWDGVAWSALGSGMDGAVLALAVFDDGTGPALYAGGEFATAGGVNANHVAKWNGSAWSDVGGGTDGAVYSLLAFQDASGSALEMGGAFGAAGSAPASNIARWDGSAWSALGTGLLGPVRALTVFDDGSNSALCAGGSGVFTWDGSTWSPVGSGASSCVLALETFDDGTGPSLFAAGDQACGASIERWDGSSWSAQSPNWNPFSVTCLSVFDGGSGPALFVGADILYSPYSLPLYLARLDGSNWIPVGNAHGLTGGVKSLSSFDDGSGPALYAGGTFDEAGSTSASCIARFDGTSWSPLDGGIGSGQPGGPSVDALTVFDDGSGPALYAGGVFTSAGGAAAQNIARWDGSHWTPLGSGVDGGQSVVRAMTVFDDGSGPALYAGGEFTTAGGGAVDHVARWDGSTWSALGGGVGGGPYITVTSMIVFDDGSGPALYVGGTFTTAGGAPANNIAKWDGSAWLPLAGGVSPAVGALAVFDDGSGPALHAGNAGGSSARVFKWDGSTWTIVGNRDLGECGVASMTVFDDGSGPMLFACPRQCAKGYPSVFGWNGFRWSDVTSPPTYGAITAMIELEGSADPASGLYLASGSPALFLGAPFSGLAQHRGCGGPGVPFCFGDGTDGPCPCGNTGVAGHGCQNSSSTGGALLAGSGDASLANDTFVMTASRERLDALSIFWQSDGLIPPRAFGDGVGCISAHPKRLFVHKAVGGAVFAPQSADVSVSHASAKHGDPITPGTTRVYEVFYRDPSPSFCPAPTGSTFNTTNALRTYWHP